MSGDRYLFWMSRLTGCISTISARLMKLFNRMTDQGNTLFIIEHSLDVMKDADYIVELGRAADSQAAVCSLPGHRRRCWKRSECDAGVSAGELIDKKNIPNASESAFGIFFNNTQSIRSNTMVA